MNKKELLFLNIFLLLIIIVVWFYPLNPTTIAPTPNQFNQPEVPEFVERKPDISEVYPKGNFTFEGVSYWLDRLNKEAPDQTEIILLGKSTEGRDIKAIRIGPQNNGKKVLITACVHGNEKLSCSVTMGVITKILKEYMVDSRVTDLLRTRQIFYIPVICPDGYAHSSRHSDDVDPNRNWNDKNLREKLSIPSVQVVKDFHKDKQFNAVMSCHNYGNLYFYPWGFIDKKSKYIEDYQRVLRKMAVSSEYEPQHIYGHSAPPYYGYEVDWFHKWGAFSIVTEIGNSFDRESEIRSQIDRCYESFLVFIDEAPLVIVDESPQETWGERRSSM